MQLMIDTATDGREQILAAIKMLQILVGETAAAPIGRLGDPVLVDGKVAKLAVESFDKPTAAPQAAPAAPSAATTATTLTPSAAVGATAELPASPPPPPPLREAPPPPPSLSPPTPAAAAVPQSAPAATAPGAAPPNQAPEFDSAGVPFDERIHQKKRGKKTDGSWKLQKGIDPAVVQSVISELSASGKMQQPGAASSAPNPPSAASVFGKSPLPAGAEAPPPPPAANPAPPPPPASDAMPTVTFRTLVAKCAAATKAGKLQPQQIAAICQQHGAPTLMALNSMAHLIPAVNDTLDAALLMA